MQIFIGTFKKEEGNQLSLALNRLGHNVTVSSITCDYNNFFRKLFAMSRLLFSNINQSEIIILETMSFEGIISIIIKKYKKIPIILYVKGYTPLEDLTFLKRVITYFYEFTVIGNIDYIVYISEWTKRKNFSDSPYTKIKQKPCSIIYHSADPFFLEKNNRESLQISKIIQISYVSNFYFLEKTKGGLLIINAFAKALINNSNIQLIILGDGRYINLLKDEVKKLNISKSVIFTGNVSKNQLRDYYLNSCFFIFASFLDGCPTVVLEAQACGIPVIVNNDCGAAEIVKNNVTGLICNSDADEIADAIDYLLGHPEERKSMGIFAMKYIKTELNWNTTAKKFDAIINAIKNEGT